MKGYSTLSRAHWHHLMQIIIIPKTPLCKWGQVHTLLQGMQLVYSKPPEQANCSFKEGGAVVKMFQTLITTE